MRIPPASKPPLTASLLTATLPALFLAGLCSASPAALPEPPPPLHVRLGPDSLACGISPPRGGLPKGGKAGLIVWLHGGMRGPNREKGFEAHRGWLEYLPPRRYYVVSPSAYAGAEWPAGAGLRHIEEAIAHMLRTYPIDAADVNMVGVSDGCLGVIAYTLQGAHPLRRRVLISSAPQLVLPLESLAGQPRFARGIWDFVQGGKDRLFPADQVMPYLERFRALYPNARLHAFPEGEHDFSWYAAHAPDLLRSFFRIPSSEKRGPVDQNPAQMPATEPQKSPSPETDPGQNWKKRAE